MSTRISFMALSIAAAFASPAFGETMYSTGGDGTQLVKFDTLTGVGTVVGATGQIAGYGLTIGLDGTLYTLVDSYSDGRLATLNPTTGAATVFGSGNRIADMMVMEIAGDGTLYTASWGTNSLYKMSTTTGAATLVGAMGFSGVMDFAFDSKGTLWASNSASLYTVNTATGLGTFVANITGTDGCNMGIAFGSADKLFGTTYCSANSPFWQIDTATGAATAINGASGISNPHGGDIALIPEPSTFALFGLGLFGVMTVRRKLGTPVAK